MPISEADGCSPAHWAEVLGIIRESLENSDFSIELVSSGDESGVIHGRIVKNLVNDDVVICDVSGRNPNVMFELGLRLAFDKPTVVIKDDKTAYNFDTSPIEHLPYPRDLRYSAIQEFKHQLLQKVNATYEAAKSDPDYSCFLKHFVEYRTSKSLPTEEVSAMELVLKELAGIRSEISIIKNQSAASTLAAVSSNPFSSGGGSATGPFVSTALGLSNSKPKSLVDLANLLSEPTLSSLVSGDGPGPFGRTPGKAHLL